MRSELTIEGIKISVQDDRVIYHTPWFRVDGDGDPTDHFHDPCWQRDTSLHGPDGKPVNALAMPYVVVNPYIAASLPAVFLGGLALVSWRGKTVTAVMADIGPHNKIGEGSEALAAALGMPPSSVNGGLSNDPTHLVEWLLFPGKPADVKGVQFALHHL